MGARLGFLVCKLSVGGSVVDTMPSVVDVEMDNSSVSGGFMELALLVVLLLFDLEETRNATIPPEREAATTTRMTINPTRRYSFNTQLDDFETDLSSAWSSFSSDSGSKTACATGMLLALPVVDAVACVLFPCKRATLPSRRILSGSSNGSCAGMTSLLHTVFLVVIIVLVPGAGTLVTYCYFLFRTIEN